MTTRRETERKPRKKLSVSRQTIRDLATRKDKADGVRGGMNTVRRCA